MSKPYTTRDVAKLLGISRGSAILRIDRGLIEAYRDPLSRRRFVMPEALEKYARENGLPIFAQDKEAHTAR